MAADYTHVPRIGGAVLDGAGTNVKIVSGGTVGNVTVAPAVTTTLNTLSQGATDGTAVVDIGALGTLRLGATGSVVVPTGSSALTFNGGTLTAGGADNTAGSLLFLNAGNDVTVNSTIANNGTGAVGVSKSGAGVLTLATANSHTGKTAVNGGTLVIADENRLGGNPAALAADQLTLNAATLHTTATFAIDDANRGMTLGAGGATFQTDPGRTLTVASAIAGTNARKRPDQDGRRHAGAHRGQHLRRRHDDHRRHAAGEQHHRQRRPAAATSSSTAPRSAAPASSPAPSPSPPAPSPPAQASNPSTSAACR